MAQSLIQIYVHLIYHVKTTSCCIQQENFSGLYAFTAGTAESLGSHAILIGGVNDHIHMLCTLPKTILLPDFVRQIKVASHRYLTTTSPDLYKRFAWQSGYAAFSVSPSILDKTKEYISNQPEHHRRISFREEYLRFLQEYKVEGVDERFLFSD